MHQSNCSLENTRRRDGGSGGEDRHRNASAGVLMAVDAGLQPAHTSPLRQLACGYCERPATSTPRALPHGESRVESFDFHGQRGAFAAADVAAGIGRVAKHVLLPGGAASVDVLEPARTLRAAACAFVDAPATVEGVEVGGCASKCRFLAAPMQDWTPSSSSYDVIWAQWCVGHLTDAHFLRFLQRCRTALKPRGVLVIKDNCGESSKTDDCFEVDDADRSICRGRAYLEALLALSGAELLCTALQPLSGVCAFPATSIRAVRRAALG